MMHPDDIEEQHQISQSEQSAAAEVEIIPSSSTSLASSPARFYYHDKFVLMYKGATGETCIDEMTGTTSFKEVTRFHQAQDWTSIITYRHVMGAYLLFYKATTGDVQLGQLMSTGQVENRTTLSWEPGWTSMTSLHIGSNSFLIKSSTTSRLLVFMQITPENSFVEVSRIQRDIDWTSLVTYTVNRNHYLLSYHSETSMVSVSLISNNNSQFSIINQEDLKWTSGWSTITSYYYKNNSYLLMIKAKTGEACVDRVTNHGIPKFARWYNWRPNWTICVALCPSLPTPRDSRGLVIARQELTRGGDYSHTDFTDARFHHIDIGNSGSIFNNRPMMDYTIFDGASLVDVTAKQARLKGSQMFCAVLINCQFEYANLSYSNLSAMIATDCSFEGAKLIKANLDNATLIHVKLIKANLSLASLVNTNITDTDILSCRSLDHVDLSKTIGDIKGKNGSSKWINTNFNTKKIINTSFTHELYNNKFNNSVFIECNFRGMRSDYTSFISAIFTQCSFNRRQETVTIQYADGTKSTLTTFTPNNFVKANFSYATFNECHIGGSNFIQSSFNYAILNGIKICSSKACSTFGNSQPSYSWDANVNFNSCTFIGVSIKDAELISLDFSSHNFENADLTNTSLTSVNFSNANLRGAILTGIHSQYSETISDKIMDFLSRESPYTLNFDAANLKNANLSGAVLIGATLKNAILMGADLRGTNLSQADLSNAIIDETTKLDGAILTDAKIHWLHYEQLSKAGQSQVNNINNYWSRKSHGQINHSHKTTISHESQRLSASLTQSQLLNASGLFASSSRGSSSSHIPVEETLSIQDLSVTPVPINETKTFHACLTVTYCVDFKNKTLYQFNMRGLALELNSEQQTLLNDMIRSETIWPYQQGFVESGGYFRELSLDSIHAARYLLHTLGDLLKLSTDDLQLPGDSTTEEMIDQSKAAMSNASSSRGF